MLSLKLTVLQQSDNKALVFTDATGTGTTGWGYDTNPAVTSISTTSSQPKLELSLTYKNIDTEVTFDTINLGADADFGGPYTDPSELVFTIPVSKLTNQIGFTFDDDCIPDGVWTVTYSYAAGTVSSASVNFTMCTEGVIRNKVFRNLRLLPQIYLAYDFQSQDISNTILEYSLLKGLEAMAYVASVDDLLLSLDTVDKLITNGSNFNWQK